MSEPGTDELTMRETAMDRMSTDRMSTGGTAVSPPPRATRDQPAGRQRLGGVMRMEWIRLRTLRSTWWSVAVVVVAMIGLAVWIQYYVPGQWAHMPAADGNGRPDVNASGPLDVNSPVVKAAITLTRSSNRKNLAMGSP